MTQIKQLFLQMGEVTAILVSALGISFSISPASALNTRIGNLSSTTIARSDNVGQSFINDPAGSGSTINLDTWTVGFDDTTSQATALSTLLTIYSGTGNGGTVVGSSSTAANLNFGRFFLVQWTFNGGLQIIDNAIYTAVLAPSLVYQVSVANPYANGTATLGSVATSSDLVFRATFSAAAPVPFEFSPALGLGVLGGLFALKKLVKKKKSS